MAVKEKSRVAVATNIPVSGVRGKRVSVHGIEAKIEDVVLHSEAKRGAKLNVELGGAIVGAELSRTIEGASTLTFTVYDPKNKILQAAILRRRFNCRIGPKLWFTLVGVKKSGKYVTLTFEDREVAWLRELKGPKKAFRDQVTRAEFFLMLLKDVKKGKIQFYCPELHKVQQIKSDKNLKEDEPDSEDTKKQSQRLPGLGKADMDEVTFKGVKSNIGQIHITDIVLDTGMSMGVPYKLLVCAVMTITQESNATDLAIADGPNGEGYGPFSQTAAWRAAGYPGGVHGDVAQCARGFFQVALKVHKANPNMAKGPLCQEVQHAGAGELYSQWENESTGTVDTYLGGASVGDEVTSVSTEVTKRYPFQVDRDQEYWDWMGEAADEVHWRRFMVAGKLYYLAETTLLKSQVRMLITPESQGIENVDFDYTMGKKVIEATITCWAKDWAAPPGTVVKFKGYGPLDGVKGQKFRGRYIVTTINSNLFTDYVTVTVKKAMRPLPEPAPETETRTVQIPGGGGDGASTGSLESVRITNSSLGAPYWGGTAAIFKQFVNPFMEEHGITPRAEKEEGHTSGSDHALYSKNAYATDNPTTDGAQIANELGRAMGRDGDSVGTYERFTIEVDGMTFSVQILWAVPDHYDHIHVGIQRI